MQALGLAKTLHERVAGKFVQFLEAGIAPEAYLYRHYHPNGDLLYVGITLWMPDRTKRHLSEADWRDLICLIVVEPFTTREQALDAEQAAIRAEFPKYNRTHNGHRCARVRSSA
jgi:predicted GIY-YIG superfamily endonuclease